MPTPTLTLLAERLACVRGGEPVFADVSFSLASGDALILKGANGAGKTSLLELAAGLLAPASGRIGFEDVDAARARTHYVGHRGGVQGALSCAETLGFWHGVLTGTPAPRGAIDEALSRFGLGKLAETPARALSVGQMRRLALARLCLVPRALWLLDEPFAHLDAAGCRILDELLTAHLEEGGMWMMALHEGDARASLNTRRTLHLPEGGMA